MTKAIDRVWGFINEERTEKLKEAFHFLNRRSRSPNWITDIEREWQDLQR